MSIKRLPATAMNNGNADIRRTYHHVNVDPDVTMEDITRPNFWAYHVARLNPGDLVDVLAKDFSLDVQLRVVSKETGLVTMRVLRQWQSSAPKTKPVHVSEDDLPELPENYKVQYAPKSGWLTRTIDPPETVGTSPTKPEAYRVALVHAKKAMGVAA